MQFEIPDYSKIRQDSIGQETSSFGKNKMSQALQSDQDNDNKLLETKVFKNFLLQNSDDSRKKVLLVISGSYMEGEDRSQSYPNYLREMAQSNPDCDFLVLNIDPNFTTNLNPEGDIAKNVNLKFLKGHLNPVKNPQFYSEIGNNLYRFDKVVFCSHTYQLGVFEFNSLPLHCKTQGTDCITIGAYWNQSPCCIMRDPLIEKDFIPTIHPDTEESTLSKEDKNTISAIGGFLSLSFGAVQSEADKNSAFAERKTALQTALRSRAPDCFFNIEDKNFIKAVTQFVGEKEVLPPKSDLESKKVLSPKSDLESKELTTIFGLGTGAIVGLTCVSAPAFAIVAGTTIAGATAFYLINQEVQNNHKK